MRLGIAAVLWLTAAAFAIAITFIFRTGAVEWVVTLVLGALAALLSVSLIARANAMVVNASNGLAVAWTVLYAVLTVQQSGELAAWVTDIALIAIGAAAGLAAYRADARAKLSGNDLVGPT